MFFDFKRIERTSQLGKVFATRKLEQPWMGHHNLQGGIAMVKIEAIIKPFRLTEVQEALVRIGVQGMTVAEVKGFGRQKGHVEFYRGAEYKVDFVPKLLLTVVVQESLAEQVLDAIQKAAYTGKIGDGKIFVSRISDVMRIRTRETGPEAL
jgi:nitrogen regulatory protein P-II 1